MLHCRGSCDFRDAMWICAEQVLKDLGLCVTLYDISNVEGGSVFPGDGAPHFTVRPSFTTTQIL